MNYSITEPGPLRGYGAVNSQENLIHLPALRGMRHPNDAVLEYYVMHRLGEAAQIVVEEHLLLCECCRERVGDIEISVRAARRAPAGAGRQSEPKPVIVRRTA